jgi:hypothetical protein
MPQHNTHHPRQPQRRTHRRHALARARGAGKVAADVDLLEGGGDALDVGEAGVGFVEF